MTKSAKRNFELTWSEYHHQWKIELTDASKDEHAFLRRAIMANHLDDPFYIARSKANPFLQGGCNETDGWILIEFWSTKERAEEYVKWLNEQWQSLP